MLAQKPVRRRVGSRYVVAASVRARRARHRQVAGQDVEERRDVGRALDRRVAAQGEDAAAGAADVAEQQLDDRGGADVLHAHRVLGPADGVARGRSCARGPSSRTAPRTPRGTARCETPHVSLDELGGVAGEVPLQQLEDAARVLQRLVARAGVLAAARARRRGAVGRAVARSGAPLARRCRGRRRAPPRDALVLPGLGVVGARSRGPSPEKSAVEILGVAEVLGRRSSRALV